jgi:hypothetical protein
MPNSARAPSLLAGSHVDGSGCWPRRSDGDSSDDSDGEEQGPRYKLLSLDPKGTSTPDAAMLGFLMLQYDFDITYIVPIVIHGISQFFQVVLCFEFFLFADTLEDMYEPAQYNKVAEIMREARKHNVSLIGNLSGTPLDIESQNYSRVFDWAHKQCSKHDVSTTYSSVVSIMVLMLLCGKAVNDLLEIGSKQWVMSHLSWDSSEMEELDSDTKDALRKPPKKTQLAHAGICTQLLSCIFIFLPHFCTHIMVAFLSAKYVCVQSQIDKIIKSAIKLYFITKFDPMIAKAFTSAYFKKLLKSAEYKIPKSHNEREWHASWGSTVLRLLVAFVFALVCQSFIFPGKFMFGDECDQYLGQFPSEHPMNQLVFGNATTVGLKYSAPFTT